MQHKPAMPASHHHGRGARLVAASLLGGAILLALSLPAAAQASPRPCAQITQACRHAGFVYGGSQSGNGLFLDCVQPIMQGRAQRPAATRPLPTIDQQLLAACKTVNPKFGQGTAGAPPPANSGAPLPAPVATDGGKFLDAKSCGDDLDLGGTDVGNTGCQLWKLVADSDGWSRLQIKYNGKPADQVQWKICR